MDDEIMVTAVLASESSAFVGNEPWIDVDEVKVALTTAKPRAKKTKQLLEDALRAIEQLEERLDDAAWDYDTRW